MYVVPDWHYPAWSGYLPVRISVHPKPLRLIMTDAALASIIFFSTVAVILVGIWVFMKYTERLYDGYPKNPFKWAQESRRQENAARARRIRSLEHSLGYRPCSDDKCLDPKCIVRGARNGGHPIWDDPALPAPPPMIPIDDLVKKAYDRQVQLNHPARFKRGTASGGPK